MKTFQYFTVIFLFLLCYNISAQIKYVDVKPDIRLEGVHHLPLDLDSNGSIDFTLIHDTLLGNWPNEGSQINVIHHMGINEVVGVQNGHFFPKALYFNTLINEQSKSWGNFEDNLALYVWVITNNVKSHYGYWQYLTEDRFVGFRMNSKAGQLNGWIRLFVSPDGKYMILKDYAYNETPSAPIYTGEGIPIMPIKEIVVENVPNFGDGRDLRVTYNTPENEIALSHYRIMFVKNGDVPSFDIQAAQQVPAGSFIKIYRGQTNYQIDFDENTSDVNGELLKSGESYNIFVLSVGICMNNPPYTLSEPSDIINLLRTNSIENDQIDSKINISQTGNQLKIVSNENDHLIDLEIYRINGQLLYANKSINSIETEINIGQWHNEMIILNIKTKTQNHKIKCLIIK